jgi:hypothetical protein
MNQLVMSDVLDKKGCLLNDGQVQPPGPIL